LVRIFVTHTVIARSYELVRQNIVA